MVYQSVYAPMLSAYNAAQLAFGFSDAAMRVKHFDITYDGAATPGVHTVVIRRYPVATVSDGGGGSELTAWCMDSYFTYLYAFTGWSGSSSAPPTITTGVTTLNGYIDQWIWNPGQQATFSADFPGNGLVIPAGGLLSLAAPALSGYGGDVLETSYEINARFVIDVG